MRENTLLRKAGSIFLAFVVAVVMLMPSTAFAEEKTADTDSTHTDSTYTAGTEEADAPKVKSVTSEGGIMGKYYRVAFEGESAAFIKAMEKGTVTLNGEEAKRVKQSFFNDTKSYKFSNDPAYGGDNIFIDFTEDCFKTGEVKVVAGTEGYKELSFTMKDGKLVKEEEKPVVPSGKKAPEIEKSTLKSTFGGKYYQISFAKGDNVTPFIDGIKNVTANGKKVERKATFFNDTNSYKPSNDSAYGGGNIFVDFTEDVFKGEVKIVIESEGFNNLTFNVKDGVIVEGKEEPEEVKIVTASKYLDLGWAEFLVIDLEDGYNIDNVRFAVDGTEVETTKVTDDGNIVKWEVSELSHKELVVTGQNGKETVTIGKKAGKVTKREGKTLPDYFMANGPVYVWDYQLRNYDDNGNVRVTPAKTTFNMDGKKKPVVKSYSPDAELIPDENSSYGIKGEAELMFNYAKGTEEEKAFVDGITDVDLVAYNEYRNTINDELEYTLDKNFAHNGSSVACIKVPLGQTNFYANGRYYLRVTSGGQGNLFPIHVVNHVTPSMTLTNEYVISGQDVHFRVKDLTFGVTMPVYRAVLTDPDGIQTELKKIEDYYLIGDLFVLYNNTTNHLEKPGTYKIDVYADGFKPFSKTFEAGPTPRSDKSTTMASLDGIATASVGSGGGGGGGDAMDTKVMNANLIFNTDLLVNAKAMVKMGIDNPLAEGISDRWDKMTKISLYNEGADKVYDADSYFDAANKARTDGRYLTFKEYAESENAVTTKNRPYSVKQVLEDNLLGDVTDFNEASGHMAPDMVLVKTEGQKVVFSCSDANYLKSIAEGGSLSLNDRYSTLSKKQYAVDINEKTLTINKAAYGENTLVITTKGYQKFKMVFNCEKVNEIPELKITGTTAGADITVECTAHKAGGACDFFANMKNVKVIAPDGTERTIRPVGQEGVDIGYTYEDNKLTIGGKILKETWAQNEDGSLQTGIYKVVISAEYYGDQTLSVNLKNSADPDETIDAPTVKEITEEGGILGKYNRVSFNESEDITNAFIEAINNVTVNNVKVTRKATFFNDTNSYKPGKNDAFGGGYIYVDFTTDCFAGEAEVVISADGYNDLTFRVKDGALVTEETDPEPESPDVKADAPKEKSIELKEGMLYDYYKVAFEGDDKVVAPFIEAVNNINIDGKKVDYVSGFFNTTNGYLAANDEVNGGAYVYLNFSADCFKGEREVVISADGYNDLTFKVKDGVLVTDTESPEGEGGAPAPDTDNQDKPGTDDQDKPDIDDQDKPDTDDQDKPDADNQDKPDADNQDKPDADNQDKPDADSQDKPDADNQDKPDADNQDKPDADSQNRPVTDNDISDDADKDNAADEEKSPETGDTAELLALMAAMIVAAGGAAAALKKARD